MAEILFTILKRLYHGSQSSQSEGKYQYLQNQKSHKSRKKGNLKCC